MQAPTHLWCSILRKQLANVLTSINGIDATFRLRPVKIQMELLVRYIVRALDFVLIDRLFNIHGELYNTDFG